MISIQPQVRRYQRIDRQAPRFEATCFGPVRGRLRHRTAAVLAANWAEVTSELATILD